MIVKHFYDEKLAQASYLVGCGATGEALVIDPNRDIEQYMRWAEQEGVEITHVTETHIHADFVSGSRELAERTGARLYLSDEGDENWKYLYAEEAGAVLLEDGETFRVGNVEVKVLHTPGHTPEHLSFVVTDKAAADEPMGVFTGDFIFVGDVGRPDLLEKVAGVGATMEAGARTLYGSLQRFRHELPDFVQIWPGHGAGSACGKSLGAVPQSTLGYEKRFNWGLTAAGEEEFVGAVLTDQPDPPRYFAQMKRINKEGPRVLGGFKLPPRLTERRLPEILAEGALVIDTRHWADFAARHVPRTINVPLNRSFTTWAGWLAPYDHEFYLIIEDSCSHCIEEAVKDLAMIGLDRVAGYWGAEAVGVWGAEGRPLETVPQVTSDELLDRLRTGEVWVVDVRDRAEWNAGHIATNRGEAESSVSHIPVGQLTDRLDEIPRDRPVIVHCQGGGRSAIAASILQASGFESVLNLAGGFSEWRSSGKPEERETNISEAVASA